MRVLIDEDLDVRLRHLFPDYETYTVEYMGWKGLPNGEMLANADAAGFALLITGDTNMADQQNMSRRSIHILLIKKSRAMDDAHIAEIRERVDRRLR